MYDDSGLEVLATSLRGPTFAEASLPKGTVVDGILKDPGTFVATLKHALAGAKPFRITARHVIVGLPETRVFTTLVQLPNVRQKEIEGALTWQLPTLLPASPDELVVDFQPIHAPRPDERQVLLVAAPLALVTPLVTALDEAGFQVVRSVPRSVGVAQLFNQPEHTPILIVDREAGDAQSLIIVKNGTARFSTTVSLDRHQGRLSSAIERAVEFYEKRDGQNRKVAKVLVLPHPDADELVSQLHRELKLPVRMAEGTWARRHGPLRLKAFLSNLGLLRLKGVRLNLLPPALKLRRDTERRSQQYKLAWLTELVLAGGILALTGNTLQHKLITRTLLTTELAALPLSDPVMVAEATAIDETIALHTEKQPLRSKRFADYQAFARSEQGGVRLQVLSYDPVKQTTRLVGERSDRDELARYLRSLRPTFGAINLADDDWIAIDQAPFHLTTAPRP